MHIYVYWCDVISLIPSDINKRLNQASMAWHNYITIVCLYIL